VIYKRFIRHLSIRAIFLWEVSKLDTPRPGFLDTPADLLDVRLFTIYYYGCRYISLVSIFSHCADYTTYTEDFRLELELGYYHDSGFRPGSGPTLPKRPPILQNRAAAATTERA